MIRASISPVWRLDNPRSGAGTDRERLAQPGLDKTQHRRRIRSRPANRADERDAVLIAAEPLDEGSLGRERVRSERSSPTADHGLVRSMEENPQAAWPGGGLPA